jgi:hypothetical protein
MRPRRKLRMLSRRTGQRIRGLGRSAIRARSDMPPSTMHPVFVGGTGRSGTTITSGLLGQHPGYLRLRTEVKFISDKGGLTDLVEGRTTIDRFERRLLRQWFDRGERKGLKVILDRADIEAALGPLRDGMEVDPPAAAATFAHRLLDPLAASRDKRSWIEMTPSAALKGHTLHRIFPDMKLLHMVRDGRDVAASVVRMSWGPNDPIAALDWWGKRVERAFAAGEHLPADAVLVIPLEDLVVRDRDRVYARLLAFMGFDDDPAMRAYFDTRMPAEAMHHGRWRTDIPSEMLSVFEAHYTEIAERLRQRGYPYDPGLVDA